SSSTCQYLASTCQACIAPTRRVFSDAAEAQSALAQKQQQGVRMSKILVLYYSSYGHVEALAAAVAEGARSAGASVDVKRVPETVPLEIAKTAYFKLDQKAPIATVAELANYDAIVVGTPTRFGRISSQMAAFLDQAGGL